MHGLADVAAVHADALKRWPSLAVLLGRVAPKSKIFQLRQEWAQLVAYLTEFIFDHRIEFINIK